jgi:hypothetical protein
MEKPVMDMLEYKLESKTLFFVLTKEDGNQLVLLSHLFPMVILSYPSPNPK